MAEWQKGRVAEGQGSGGADRGSGRKADQRRTAEVEYHRGRGAEADRGRVV